MKTVRYIALALCLAGGGALAQSTEGTEGLEGIDDTGTPEAIDQTLQSMERIEVLRQNCYSGRRCTGKILSHRDAHNCKVKSKGKSWSNTQGACYNL